MNRLFAIALASIFALTATATFAADPPKDATATKKAALEKPANVTAEAWGKMSDAEKQKAVDAAKKEAGAKTKKEKKGGC